ncbi:MAG: hypothetical protein IT428_06640 [Planctomycetaceae bacterium]|nr:hypothetical protein [Planctomycetaceae bacterium]
MLSGFSDDQIALFGCMAALLVCGGLMSLSYYLRPRDAREHGTEESSTIAFPRRAAQEQQAAGDRRAA